MDPLWKLELTSVRIYCTHVPALYNWLCAHAVEQGFRITTARASKRSLTITADEDEDRPLVVKIRIYELDPDAGLLTVEWQRRRGCALRSEAGWQALRFQLVSALMCGSLQRTLLCT